MNATKYFGSRRFRNGTCGFSGDGIRFVIEDFAVLLMFVSPSGINEISHDKLSSAYLSLGCVRRIARSVSVRINRFSPLVRGSKDLYSDKYRDRRSSGESREQP